MLKCNNIKRNIRIANNKNTELRNELNRHSNFDIDKSKQECQIIQEKIIKNKSLVRAVDGEIIESDKEIKALQEHIKEIIKLEIKKKILQIDAIEKDITEFNKSIKLTQESIKKIIKLEIKENGLQLSIIKNKNIGLNKEARIIKANIKTIINPLNWSLWFSDEQTQFRHKYKELKIDISDNERLIQTIFKTIGYFEQNIKNLSPNIERYLNSNIDKEINCLDELNTGISNKEKHKESVLKLVDYLKQNISDLHPNIDKCLNTNAKEILNNISKLQKDNKIKNSQKLLLLKNIRHSEEGVMDLKANIDEYLNFDAVKVKNDIDNLESKINTFKKEAEREEKIEIVIAPLETEIEKLRSDNMSAQDDITIANSFCDRLDIASNSYERAQIHEECELKLNEGSPKKIINQQNKVIRSNEKNIKKLEHRIKDIIRKGRRIISEVIIDGNNMCYEGSSFIGLVALKEVIPELQKYYKVTVIFDSIIRKHLDSGNKQIKLEFNSNTYIHIVSTKQYADENILDLASNNSHIFVISNDRYGDYPDKEVKQNGRLIRYEIIKNRIFIGELDIDISWIK